jgi:hypothetical protein
MVWSTPGADGEATTGQSADRILSGMDVPRDFFVSHASDDLPWAEWIASCLENAGYSVELDAWDWTPGQNVVEAMHRALQRAGHVVTVYTNAYFAGSFAQAEHSVAVSAAISGRRGRVLPIRVEECDVPGLYSVYVPVDLVGLTEADAAARLLEGVARAAGPPAEPRETSVRNRAAAGSSQAGRYPGLLAEGDETSRAGHDQTADACPGIPALWNLPRRNPFFTGRSRLLVNLHQRLGRPRPAPLSPPPPRGAIVPLCGPGGTGKSQLAVEYAHRRRGTFRVVWWVDAETENRAASCLMDLARALIPRVAGSRSAALRQLWTALARRSDWLLIFDNLDDPRDLAALTPPDSGRTILTSRSPAVARLAPAIEVAEFLRTESRRLLRAHHSALTIAEANRVAAAVGDLPLAVAQAGCYLAETGLSVVDYLALLGDHPAAAGLSDPTVDRHPGLLSVVTLGRARLAAADADTADLLDQVAYLAADPLLLTPSGTGADRLEPTAGVQIGDALRTASAVRQMTRLGLVRHSGSTIRLHRLVALIMRQTMGPDRRDAALTRAQSLLTSANIIRLTVADSTTWPTVGRLAPHVQELATWLHRRSLRHWEGRGDGVQEIPQFRTLILHIAWFFFVSAQYDAGRRLAGEARVRWQQHLGADHPDALAAADIEATVLVDGFGESQVACELLTDTCVRRRRVLGPTHRDTLRSAWNLAYTLGEIGDHAAAIDLHRATLATQRMILGPDHADTLLSAHSLGYALTMAHAYGEAYGLLLDMRARRVRTLGETHPDALRASAVLGIALRGLGRIAEARDLHHSVLAESQQRLGPDHPVTLFTALHLALDYDASGEVAAARELFTAQTGWSPATREKDSADPDMARWLARHHGELAQIWPGA